MKKTLIIFCLLSCFSCNKPNFKIVESQVLKKDEYKIHDEFLKKMYELYTNSDKTKTNYEVYGYKYGINYNPSKKVLFVATDLCEWGWTYINVDEDKLKNAIAQNIKIGDDGYLKEYDNFFEREKDSSKAYKIKQESFNTNSCSGGKVPF